MEEIKNKNQEMCGEEEINLLDYWRVIQKHRKLIGKIVLVTVVLTAVISLFMANIYRGKALITPISPKGGGGNLSALAQQFGSPAGFAGLSLPSSASGTVSLPELVNLLNSNIVREKMIQKYNLLPVLFYNDWDADKKDWKRGGITLNPLALVSKAIKLIKPRDPKAPKKKDDDIPDIQDGLRELEDIVGVKQNIKENTITISVDYPDPEMAARMTSYLLEALNDHITGEAKRVAKINREYLEDQITKNSDPIIKQKIYNLVADQIETIMMAEVKENFAFKVLDPPMVPDKKIKPKRTLMVILSLFVSAFIGVFVAFFKEYLEKIKAQASGGPSVHSNVS